MMKRRPRGERVGGGWESGVLCIAPKNRTMKSTLRLSLLACVLAFCQVCDAQPRTWTDTTGTHTIQAELIGFDGFTVTLKKADGKTVAVKGDLLSKEDMAFILSHPLTGIGYDAVGLADALPGMKEGTPAPPVTDGILVVGVFPTSPAEKAGLRSYDIIASVDGQPAKLRVGLYYRQPGRSYKLVVYRLGTEKENDSPTWRRLDMAVSVLPIDKINAIRAKICPLAIQSVRTGTNEAGTPRIVVTVKNEGRQSVVGFKVAIEGYDKNGDPVRKAAGNGVVGVSQDKIDAGKLDDCGWDVQDGAATYKISVESVKTEDGKEWTPTPGFERSVRTK
jgi:hypothetical protein